MYLCPPFACQLIEEYDTDPFVKELRDVYDWFILPSVNPDGYAFSWTTVCESYVTCIQWRDSMYNICFVQRRL